MIYGIIPAKDKEEGDAPAASLQRPWFKLRPDADSAEQKEHAENAHTSVRILSYNVLGPIQGVSSKHDYCPLHDRVWNVRKGRLMSEIESYGAGIVCLQEVTPISLRETWIPFFSRLSMDGYCYQAKLDKGVEESNLANPDSCLGVAIFYNTNDWKEVDRWEILLRDLIPEKTSVKATEGIFGKDLKNFRKDVEEKSDAAVLLALERKNNNIQEGPGGEYMIVGNVHLWWDPKTPDIKTMQTHLLMEAVERFIERQQRPEPRLVICGDFNSTPYVQHQFLPKRVLKNLGWPASTQVCMATDQFGPLYPEEVESMSGVCALLSTGDLSPPHAHHPETFRSPRLQATQANKKRRTTDGGACVNSQEQQGTENRRLGTGRPLMDVYRMSPSSHPKFTTKTGDFSGIIDYIWVTPCIHKRVSGVLLLPIGARSAVLDGRATARRETPHTDFNSLPNSVYGSDHLALGVEVDI